MKKNNYIRELAVALAIIFALYLFGLIFGETLISILTQVPFFNTLYNLIELELANRSIFGLSIITFFGGLFFIGYPGELLFLIYAKVGYSVFFLSLVMLLWTMLSQIVNYGFGFFIEKKIIKGYIKDRHNNYMHSLKKYDFAFIVILNILPLPADILTVILGMVKYDFKKAMLYTGIGKILKYVFLIMLILVMRIFHI